MTSIAIVDTSCLVAVAFGEPPGARLATRLRRFDRLFAAELLEAELLATFQREGVEADTTDLTRDISLVSPDRPLSQELGRVSAAGYLRGADMWHVACALFLSPEPGELTFLTLDQAQRAVARRLGFMV